MYRKSPAVVSVTSLQIITATLVVEAVSIAADTLYLAQLVVTERLAGVFSNVQLAARVGLTFSFTQAEIRSDVTESAVLLQEIIAALTLSSLVVEDTLA